MKRLRGCTALLGLSFLLAGTLPSSQAASTPTRLSGTWSGGYTIPAGASSLPLTVDFRGSRARVFLPGGHSLSSATTVRRARGRVRFAVPGRQPVLFDGTLSGRVLTGRVAHAGVRGRFRLVRKAPTGAAARVRYLGLYGTAAGDMLAVSELVGAFAAGQPRLTVLDEGETRGLFTSGMGRFAVGGGISARMPEAGTLQFAASGGALTWRRPDGSSITARRVPLRYEEVRFRSGSASLAGTLTLPPGSGPHPALAVVHGSGATPRALAQIFAAFFVRHGVAVLAYDKRGIGQSGGTWPGEGADPDNIDVYARDAQAAIRFLASRPDTDRARIGLWGTSQAGWIVPLAATRERLVSFAAIGVGPTVTEGEQVYYSRLTTQGASVPDLPREEIERLVDAATPGGTDPIPWIRAFRIPALWVFGALDQHVPTRRSVEILERIKADTGGDLSWLVFPNAAHGLVEVRTGLQSEIPSSPRYAPGLFAGIRDWLNGRGITP